MFENHNFTGLGGGFNERGVVEYKEHTSDDEYDDFGRKKKKRSSYGVRDHSYFWLGGFEYQNKTI